MSRGSGTPCSTETTSPTKNVSSPLGNSDATRPVSHPIAPAISGGPSPSTRAMPCQWAIGGTPRAKCWATSIWPAASRLTPKAPARRSSSCSAASRRIAKPTSGGAIESGIRVPIVKASRSPSRSTLTTATPAGNRRIRSRRCSPLASTSGDLRCGLVLAAEPVAVQDRVELRIHRRLECHVGRVPGVEVVQPVRAPHDVGRDAGAGRRKPVHVAVAHWAHPVEARRMGIATGIGGVLEEAVAEDARRVVRDKRVLALPAGAVGRVVRVEVEQPTVAVRGGAEVGRAEAVDRLSEVRVAAEQVVEPTAVDPVLPHLELRDVRVPVREMQLPLAQAGRPRGEAEVGKLDLPLLQRPVA